MSAVIAFDQESALAMVENLRKKILDRGEPKAVFIAVHWDDAELENWRFGNMSNADVLWAMELSKARILGLEIAE